MRKINKKGLATETAIGVGVFVLSMIILFVVIGQVNGAGLLDAGTEQEAVDNLSANLTAGVNKIAIKIPTFFVIIAAVLILSFVMMLWFQFRKMNLGGGSGAI